MACMHNGTVRWTGSTDEAGDKMCGVVVFVVSVVVAVVDGDIGLAARRSNTSSFLRASDGIDAGLVAGMRRSRRKSARVFVVCAS